MSLLSGYQEENTVKHDTVRPLAVRMRPETLADVVGQKEALSSRSPLRRLAMPVGDVKLAAPSSIILYGPPGVGKTTLAEIVANQSGRKLVELSATTSGVKDVKKAIDEARRRLEDKGVETILFVDEIHRFSKAQQDALLPGVENRDVTFIAATTENPSFSVIRPLLSRSVMVRLHTLDDKELTVLVDRALKSDKGLDDKVSIDDEAKSTIVRLGSGDARKTLSLLEAAASAAIIENGNTEGSKPIITKDDVDGVMKSSDVKYDRTDEHYDVASAFIKSMRGSDPDAAIHWAARMLRGGEDPRFIARRVMIAAAEEVGMAQPQALEVAVAAAQAVEMVGMPEARIPLAEAIIAVATAPKSNAAYLSMDRAIVDIDAGKGGPVPIYLRNATSNDKRMDGYGDGYLYAHDEPDAIARQEYMPEDLRGTIYYEPNDRGKEKSISDRLDKIRKRLHGPDYDGKVSDDHDEEAWVIGRKSPEKVEEDKARSANNLKIDLDD